MAFAEKVEGPYIRIETRAFAKDAEFEPRPSALVLIACLEIVIRDDYGDYILVFPRSEEVELPKGQRTRPEEGYWAVPFIAKTVDAHTRGYRHVTSAIDVIDQEVQAWGPQLLLENYLRTFSFGITEMQPVGAFCELKRSWSQPHITKLYHTIRYSVALNSCAHSSLADPLSRRGHTFLPIDERYRSVTRSRNCPTHRVKETLYLEQPLASNLSAVLDDDDWRRELCAGSTQIARTHFVRDRIGLLFCGDIGGYGAASAYAGAHMGGLIDADHAAILRDSATVAFTNLFLDAGVNEIHTAGDGFICAMPLGKPSEAPAALRRFAVAYRSYLTRLEDLNGRIEAFFLKNPTGSHAPLLGSRLAIHYGPYRYGKMSQAASLLTSFDGSNVVHVSRLEQALRAITKDQDLATKYRIKDLRHTAAASRAVIELMTPKKVILSGLFEASTRFAASSKEFSETAWLLRRVRTS